jgi:hypothetical protein
VAKHAMRNELKQRVFIGKNKMAIVSHNEGQKGKKMVWKN